MSGENGRTNLAMRDGSIVLDNAADAKRWADAIVQAGFAPKSFRGNPVSVLIAMSYGREMGFKPIQSLSMVGVSNGRPFLHTDGIPAVVLRSGLLQSCKVEYTGEGDKLTCHVVVRRKDLECDFPGEFSVADAKQAGLFSKDTWKQYPKRMLLHRARTYAYRDAFADLLLGAVTSDEVPPESPTFASGDAQQRDDLDAVMAADAAPIETRGLEPPASPPEPPAARPSDETPEERQEREAQQTAF